ncbi:hypothetical protein GDO78_008748 [Eleutherodactylus coqui]|uniref:Uncharacterized protein n=1 Tax=Eleutherodactylus coqui TaxID=57060 RepID=A0A8J6FFJ4_ELECQ|nr:hypothetical protein GDO78_008748 [Eleutherodactylus coqui]
MDLLAFLRMTKAFKQNNCSSTSEPRVTVLLDEKWIMAYKACSTSALIRFTGSMLLTRNCVRILCVGQKILKLQLISALGMGV